MTLFQLRKITLAELLKVFYHCSITDFNMLYASCTENDKKSLNTLKKENDSTLPAPTGGPLQDLLTILNEQLSAGWNTLFAPPFLPALQQPLQSLQNLYLEEGVHKNSNIIDTFFSQGFVGLVAFIYSMEHQESGAEREKGEDMQQRVEGPWIQPATAAEGTQQIHSL